MKKALFLLMFLISLSKADEFKFNLLDFINLASFQNDVKIVISNNINYADFTFYTYEKYPKISIEVLQSMLKAENLVLNKGSDFYFVDVLKENLENKNNHKIYNIPLTYHIKDDFNALLELYDINSTYISSVNNLYFSTDNKNYYDEILKLIKIIDVEPLQTRIKITILETNLKEIKERGNELSAYAKSSSNEGFNYFINLITMPFNASTNVTNFSKSGFYSVVKFLDNNNFTNIKSSPYLLLRNNKELYFSSVENIPYLVQSKEVKDDKSSVTNNYDYKDVGLKIKITPFIVNDGNLDFSMDFTIEDIISINNNLPTTSKKELNGSYYLKKGDLLILSGINKDVVYDDFFAIPFLSDLWFLGNLFKFKKTETKQSVLTIAVELIQ